MADDNITDLDEVRKRRQQGLKELDEAKLEEAIATGQAELSKLIERFNKDFIVANEGGKVWVMRWRQDPAMVRQSETDHPRQRPAQRKAGRGYQKPCAMVVGKPQPKTVSRRSDVRPSRAAPEVLPEPVARLQGQNGEG
jgi:hypothetical protein